MVLSPMQYLKEEYFEPLNITQAQLCNLVNLGSKTVNELLTNKRSLNIDTAKKFAKLVGEEAKKLLDMQTSYDLEKSSYDANEVKTLDFQKNSKLLNLLNSNDRILYTYKDLYNVFKKGDFDNNKELARKIFNDVALQYVVNYMLKNSIGLSHLKKMYTFYLSNLNGEKKAKLENIFLDNEKDVVEKLCHNGEYFNNSRDFEKYLYNRLVFFKHSYYFLEKAEKTNDYKARQRAIYFYSLINENKCINYKEYFSKKYKVSLLEQLEPKEYQEPNEFGLVNVIEKRRFEQFKYTGVF